MSLRLRNSFRDYIRGKHADIRCPGVIEIVSNDKEIVGEETGRVLESRDGPDNTKGPGVILEVTKILRRGPWAATLDWVQSRTAACRGGGTACQPGAQDPGSNEISL